LWLGCAVDPAKQNDTVTVAIFKKLNLDLGSGTGSWDGRGHHLLKGNRT
jgi:hypothetical protein